MAYDNNTQNRTLERTVVPGNRTDVTSTNQQVPLTAWFTIFVILATLIFNGLIVTAYSINAELRTAFNIYILNIAVTEIVSALTTMPADFIRSFYGFWPFSAFICSSYIYAAGILNAAIRYGHLLVSLNRIWAVTFHLNYRIVHTKKIAWILVGSVWAFSLVYSMIWVVGARMSKGMASVDRDCNSGGSTAFHRYGSIISEIIRYDLPVALYLLTYPYILVKIHQVRWKQITGPLGEATTTKESKSTGHSGGAHDHHGFTGFEKRVHPAMPNFGIGRGNVLPSKPAVTGRRNTHTKSRVLTFCFIGILVCFTPNLVFYSLSKFTGYYSTTFFNLQYFLQFSYSWINPLLLYMAMPQLRQAVNRLLLCRRH